MISSQGTFALKMLTEGVITTDIDVDAERKNFEKKAGDLLSENNLNSTSVQKMFLDLLKRNGLDSNVGLYRATNNDLNQWSRVTQDSNGNLTETPCN